MDLETAKRRSVLFRKVREFFDSRSYTEIDTPLLSPDLIPEPTIENFETMFVNEFVGNRPLWLIPSPEVFMKRIIAESKASVYQMCHCFRNSEQLGRIHNPEFTMLEYYTVGADENDSIKITEELFEAILPPYTPDFLRPPFDVLSMEDAFKKIAHLDLRSLQNPRDLREAARALGLSPEESEGWDDTFNRIFLTLVEPNLPQEHPLVLTGYPRQIDCLAANADDGLYKRRWELYAGGIEVANCYKEMTDREQIAAYYKKEYSKLCTARALSGTPIPDADPAFAALDMPECSGGAIGMDRLFMLSEGKEDLEGVIFFPLSATISRS